MPGNPSTTRRAGCQPLLHYIDIMAITSTVGLEGKAVDSSPGVVPSTVRREHTRNSLLDDVAQMSHGILGNEREDEEIRGTPEYTVARRETTKGPRVAGLLG
jgi:hypothetical protein